MKRVSWLELAIFAVLIVVWLLPGFDSATFIFGLTHGIGYIALCVLIWIAILRHEAPYTLLAATLTPVGPLGSVIAIEVIERRRRAWGPVGRQRCMRLGRGQIAHLDALLLQPSRNKEPRERPQGAKSEPAVGRSPIGERA